MDFKDQVKQLAERVSKLKDQINTEEATKNAFIMPFIQVLGYDVFNPLEVVPEFVTDVGTKKGEKIDYLILRDNEPTILVECKHWQQKLDLHDGQLLRYFHVSKARFALLTNGIVYRFYSDLDQPNRMDEKPFLEINILEVKDNQIEELKKFHKSYFNVESILTTASELKYLNELKTLINSELHNPTENFVRHFAKQVYSGILTQKVLDQFTALTKKAASQYLSDSITERLKTALAKENEVTEIPSSTTIAETGGENGESDQVKIDTTVEEMECYFIIKSIARPVIDVSRVFYRDAQTYFSIILDDNNRKPICRLYLNGRKKMIGIFNEAKQESKIDIQGLNDIYNHSKNIVDTIEGYLKGNK